MLFIFKGGYKEFESRLSKVAEPKGAKADLVRAAVNRHAGPFRLSDIEQDCPGVSRDWIRALLRDMKKERLLRSIGHGAGARWERITRNKGIPL